MKRFFIIASMAVLAVGCQKTEIQNEVQNQIGFSTVTGKMTRAIVDGTTYPSTETTTQPFAVYAYGWQNVEGTNTPNEIPVMSNVEITQQTRTINQEEKTVWAANDGLTYYWPNDPRTTLNFYAYSPAYVENGTATANHQRLTFATTSATPSPTEGEAGASPVNGVAHDETNGLTLTGYVHDNMYVDFMVATPVVGAKYSATDPNGLVSNEIAGTVPVVFNHQMTQIVFNVTTKQVYPGVKFTIEEISLKNIRNQADYSNPALTEQYDYTDNKFVPGQWTNQIIVEDPISYQVFPAIKLDGANAVNTIDEATNIEKNVELAYESTATAATSLAEMFTTGVTMIPQDMEVAQTEAEAGKDSYASENVGQMFMIKYSIAGTGVAEETVVKHVPFRPSAAAVVNWGPNQKITYKVILGLNEIYFEPYVAEWSPETGNTYEFQQ